MSILLLQAIANGLMLGSIYMIMAIGFTLVFSLLRMVNFAHGEFYVLGGYGIYLAYSMLDLPFPVALLLVVAGIGLFGYLIERFLFRALRGKELDGMIAALSLAIIIQNATLLTFGPNSFALSAPVTGAAHVGPLIFPMSRLMVLVAAVAIFTGFGIMVRYTKFGRAIRALVQDTDAAMLQGVRPDRIYPLAFGIGVAMAAVAGALMAPILSISPFAGLSPMLKSFTVVILGGLGSIGGAAVGGMLLGLMESLLGTFFGGGITEIGQLLVVVVILLVRPWGLMGERTR